MKRLSEKEMKRINGGIKTDTVLCTGFDENGRDWHSVPITGNGTTYRDAVIDFNRRLKEHKTNLYYQKFSHSAKYMTV